MKILVISDIHQKHKRAKQLIETYINEVDHVVCTGDYFDAFTETIKDVEDTALLLKEYLLYNPKITCLFGNHDIPYCYANNESKCPGYTEAKLYRIRDILKYNDWNQFKYCIEFDEIVYSHAGFNPKLVLSHEILYDNRSYQEIADKTEEHFSRNISGSIYTAVDHVRSSRPTHQFGNILWGDWGLLGVLDDFSQVVGHSHRPEPQIAIKEHKKYTTIYKLKDTREEIKGKLSYNEKDKLWTLPKRFNLNMDCDLKYAAILTDGKYLKIVE